MRARIPGYIMGITLLMPEPARGLTGRAADLCQFICGECGNLDRVLRLSQAHFGVSCIQEPLLGNRDHSLVSEKGLGCVKALVEKPD